MRKIRLAVHCFFLLMLGVALFPAASAQTHRVNVPAGTEILIRTADPIDTSKQKAGYRFTAHLETNLQVDERIVAPYGTTVYGKLIDAKEAGRFKGGSEVVLELTNIVINGTSYPLLSTSYEMRGKGEGKKTTRRILGGTGLGAMIGGIAGGGTGAAIGAISGAAAGTALSAGKGEEIQIPSESLLEFRLEQPASLPVAR
jgi:hypothetical protein